MNFSISEVIEQAIQTEKLGCEFYTTMAKRFEDVEKLKNLFGMLAFKEQQHEKKFLELKEKTRYEIPENWEEASLYLRAIVESEFVLGRGKSLPSLEYVKTATDATDFALNFEKETLLYFHSLRDVVEEKGIVDEIINEEKAHIIWLREFRETVTI